MPFILVATLLFAPAPAVSTEPVVLRGATMGTTYHIKFVAKPDQIEPTKLQAEIEQLLAQIDEQMSTYRNDSELSRFNRAPAGNWIPVSPAVAEVVAAAADISEKTGGALDVTVGPLVRLWHFGPKNSDENGKDNFKPPTDETIGAARKLIGYKKLEARTDPPALRKQVDGLEVDLSSIASGYTIDKLAKLLHEHDIHDFMVEIGGEVRAAGKRPDGEPWRVAVERPLIGKRQMQTAVPLDNAAIATAGGNRKFFEYAGRRYSHVIDPSTGRPVEHSLASVTVIADTCTAADGWDTPLLVLGPERGYECAERNGIAALFIEESGGTEKVRATPAWQKRLDPGQVGRK